MATKTIEMLALVFKETHIHTHTDKNSLYLVFAKGLLGGISGKEPACQCR